ncbi:MAG: translation initiation factor IF-2 [Turicibacter sp.]|nr:translation initiation factor IF-2 [Turicibacter sp.]
MQVSRPKITKNKKKGSNQKKVKNEKSDRKSNVPVKGADEENVVYFSETLTVGELSEILGKSTAEIIKQLLMLGMMATVNQTLDREMVELVASEAGYEVKDKVFTDAIEFEKIILEDDEEDTQKRPPVVTIMGHVDHGKTTLLDTIRNSRVAGGEAGGITQHIGAYQVTHNGQLISFLDTPGHAAFTSMRARGANMTDICILVVAADDGVMPQTREAVEHAKAAKVPIIVAVNKMDKPEANPDRVMQELLEYGLVPEDWGGDTIYVQISAKQNQGIDELLEMVNLVSELNEYKANANRLATGTVIEAKLDKGRGSVATLLVQNGTLRVGDAIVVGNTFGRVRAMVNDLNQRFEAAAPSTPIEITGLNDVPQAGDRFMVFPSEKEARQIAEQRLSNARELGNMPSKAVSLDDIFSQIQEGDLKELNLIIKGDVQGSVEALAGSLQKIEVEGVKINIIRQSVGTITETDVTFAAASGAIIIGFNVRPASSVRQLAANEGVDIRLHSIIYKVIDEIEAAMKGMLDPVFVEKVTGQLEVRQTFKVSKVGTIAGCYVTEGTVGRNSGVRVIRDGIVIFEGELGSLKRFKDEVKEVNYGYECGVTVDRFNDIKEGDIIEAYVMEEIKPV